MASSKKISAFLLCLFLAIPKAASASSFLRVCSATGNCGICDIVSQAITLGKWLITGAAGLALVVIVWAAIGMITSAGNSEKIGAAKKQIIGAVVGIFIVLAAFQITALIVMTFAVPAENQKFTGNQEASEKKNKTTGPTNFLGKAWWNLCNESELREKGGKDTQFGSTAHCKYWGDGTVCKKNTSGNFLPMCFDGKCVTKSDDLPDRIKEKSDNNIENPCDFLSAVDKTYEDYECKQIQKDQDIKSHCDVSRTVEKGLCPNNGICCVPKN